MRNRGFTVVELVAAVALSGAAVSVVAVTQAGSSGSPELRDAQKLQGIWQALSLWSGMNDGDYPLASALDRANNTVPELGRAKDTTANIMSMLANNGYITCEMLVSSGELNERISEYETYEADWPEAAVDPERALWDPALSADFTAEEGGHISFAHLIPVGWRLDMWSNTGRSDEAILSNRGPEIGSVGHDAGRATTAFANPKTLTTRFFAEAGESWTGNVVYNDGHVSFARDLYQHNESTGATSFHRPIAVRTGVAPPTDYHDVLFADEEGFDSNQFLGIFTTAGAKKEDYTAIWD